MNLLVDLGNTRLKWATAKNVNNIVIGEAVINSSLTHKKLIQLWRNISTPEKLAISHVGKKNYHDIVLAVATELWPSIQITTATAQTEAFGIINAYEQSEKLGVDRWLGMIASFNQHRRAFCLVGCGTAITVDLVDNSGKHLGGLISPGLRLMRESLHANTANLNLNVDSYPFGLANHTDAAIYNGTLAAAFGLIEISLNNRPDNLLLILTGGDADIIAGAISKSNIIEPNLVLQGLALLMGTP